MNVIIFAGGQGTRLWPASRANKPKQFLKLVGDKTLLEQTFGRLKSQFKPKQVFVATNQKYARMIKKQLPKVPVSNFSLEPSRKNRGPALGLAVLIMQHNSKDDVFATVWSDDHIINSKLYLNTLASAGKIIKSNPNQIIAIGIKPTTPSPAFCYIQTKKGVGLLSVQKFTDKPSIKQAVNFLKSGNYFWNTGYFISSGSHILSLYQSHYPKSFEILMKIKPFIGTSKQSAVIKKYYSRLEAFDFEDILRKDPKQLKMLVGNFGWADIGRWSVIKDIQSSEKDNLIYGKVATYDTTGSLIYNYNPKQIVTGLGLKNHIIVNTPEALLIADKNNTEELKDLIKILEKHSEYKKFL
ncbi:MAG TPA: sugar phosphate nucleotidyltransferase [Candidatus Doudnabacteria bacterium]|nr:sugar phosphate nucleotidyltransferase [Candidatus Doudnabacteria bacterium]